jgi:hypothetical protein
MPSGPSDVAAYQEKPQFSVSVTKLAVMSIFTFGIYTFYWFYKQFEGFRDRGEDLSPFWRTFFAPLWAFRLFPGIRQLASGNRVEVGWSGTMLALTFLLFCGMAFLPAPYALLSTFSFLPLLPIQRSVNQLNAAVAPAGVLNDSYSRANVIGIVIGALLLFVIVWALLAGLESAGRPL